MSGFGQRPMFPTHAQEIWGLNVQQYIWLQLFSASLAANSDATHEQAIRDADIALPLALKRLEELE